MASTIPKNKFLSKIWKPKDPKFNAMAQNFNILNARINNLEFVNGDVQLKADGGIRLYSNGVDTSHPWKTTSTYDSAAENYILTIRPGTINSLLPTNIFSTTLTANATGTYYLVLTMNTTDGDPVSASLSVVSSYPVPSATTPSHPPTTVTDVIAVINDGVVYQIRDTNLLATSVEVFQETVANPAVGERQYIPWYRWEVTSSD